MINDVPVLIISWEKLNSVKILFHQENSSDLRSFYLLAEEVFPCLLYCGICCEIYPVPFWLTSTPCISLKVNGHPKEIPFVQVEIPQGLDSENIKQILIKKEKGCIFLSDDGACFVHRFLPLDGPCWNYATNNENSPGIHFPCVRAFINREIKETNIDKISFNKLFIRYTADILSSTLNKKCISRRVWSISVYESLIENKEMLYKKNGNSEESLTQFFNNFRISLKRKLNKELNLELN